MSGPYAAHVAINDVRLRHPFDRDGARIILPFGTSWRRRGYRVHLIEPSHPFMQASSCRVDRENWHNRVHVSWARWIAVMEFDPKLEFRYDVPLIDGTPVDLEYGSALCGSVLTNPSYVDEPHGDCLCGRADGRSFCPRCDAVLDVRTRAS
jgi:hypothetical protein